MHTSLSLIFVLPNFYGINYYLIVHQENNTTKITEHSLLATNLEKKINVDYQVNIAT